VIVRPLGYGALLVFGLLAVPACQRESIRLIYEGGGPFTGHYRVRGETRPLRVALAFAFDGHTYRYDETVWFGDDRSRAGAETVWVRGPRVWRRAAADGPVAELEGAAAGQARERALAAFPTLTDRRPRSDPAPREHRFAHPRLGDVTESTSYGPVAHRAGRAVPGSLRLVRYERDTSWEAAVDLLRLEQGSQIPAGHFVVPPAAPAAAAAPPAGTPELRALAPGVWEVVLEGEDSRSLAVELESSVAVLEASTTSAAGEAIVDAVAARLPGKPVRFVFFSHHHPHYTGGLRAFVAAGATVVTTPGNARLVEEIAGRRFTLSPDRLQREPAAARVEPFAGTRVVEDGTNRLEAIDLGAASNHTDEYVVFYLPRQRLLFHGDLGWYSGPDGALRAGRRAAGLVEEIERRKLDVETVVQGWPVVRTRGTLSLAELRAMLPPPAP
jgi:glyoxylase-like metal-dependent hydrolase (beta-lactamase superfamily II)